MDEINYNQIQNQIAKNKEQLEKILGYTKCQSQYNDSYQTLKKSLNENQIKQLDDIITKHNNLKTYESYLAYKLGFGNKNNK